MTRKRNRTKSSPEEAQLGAPPKRREQTKANTMASGGGKNGGQVDKVNKQTGQTNQPTYIPVNQTSPSYPNIMSPMSFVGNYPMWNLTSPGTPANLQFAPPITPSTPSIQGDVVAIILSRLDSMDKKLGQLNSIQQSMDSLKSRMENVDKKISTVEGKIRDLEESRDFDSNMLSDINKRQQEIDSLVKKMQKLESDQQQREKELTAEVLDLKSRSMRDNLLFHRIPEERDENCTETLLQFMEEKLHITNARDEIKLHRAHRIGTYKSDKTRPIVAKFVLYTDRERVRKSSKELQGTPYGISEQYPKEIMDRRRQLVPIMLKARQEQKEAFLRGDKLYIDRKLYTGSA